MLRINAQTNELPQTIRTALDKNYPLWQFDAEVGKHYKNLGFVKSPFLSGDWNSDGKTDFVVFIRFQAKSKTVVFLKIEQGYVFYEIYPEEFGSHYKIPPGKNISMNSSSRKFYKSLRAKFAVPNDAFGLRILREYGAMFVAARDVIVPNKVVFKDESEVREFQAKAKISREAFGSLELELQSAAMDALNKAAAEARIYNLSITPKESDSARRSYADTLVLWESRVGPGLNHWVSEQRLDFNEAVRIRNLEPVEQIPEIFKLEENGIYFAKDLSKSIIYSVAPPGTSQHLSMLALDIIEHGNPFVREILARHGWFQTVVSDLPHFTYLGRQENQLPNAGLQKLISGERVFWIPAI